MSHNRVNMYDIDPHIAEIHDQYELQTDDVALIRRLIGGAGPLRVLEPFCGTGRVLIPLALDGHALVGFDQAKWMLAYLRRKAAGLPAEVRRQITLRQRDATSDRWPRGFDLVVMGGNCLYELATPEEQECCIASAAAALKPGGHVYIDNNHMEGDLDESWRVPGLHNHSFPTGICDDGTRLEAVSETVWFSAPRRLWRSRRTVTITSPDGAVVTRGWVQQKHPVSVAEQRAWLHAHGLAVEELFGDRDGSPYSETSGRAIFWARKAGV